MKFSYLFLDACVVVRFGLGVKSLRSDHMVFGGKKCSSKEMCTMHKEGESCAQFIRTNKKK